MSSESLIKRITSITVARSISIVSALLVSMLLARIISAEDLGQYKTLWILYGVMGPIITSSLNGLIYFKGAQTEKISQVIMSSLIWASLAGFVMMALMWFGFPLWERLLHAEGLQTAFRNFSFYLLFSGISSPIESVFVLKRRNKWLFWHNLISNSLEICTIVIPFSMGYSLEVVTSYMVITPLLRTVFLVFLLNNEWKSVFESAFKMEWIQDGKYALSLAFVSLAGIISVQIDSWFIRWFYESDSLFAEYVLGARKIPFLSALLGAVSAALIIQIGTLRTEQTFEGILLYVRKISGTLFSLIVPFLVLFLIYAKEIMLILFDGYEASAPVFQIYIGTVLVHFIFADTFLLAYGNSKKVLQASLIEIACNMILSVLFLQWIGFLGPAWATLISHVIYIALCILFVSKEHKTKLSIAQYVSYSDIKLGLLICLFVGLISFGLNSLDVNSLIPFAVMSVVLSIVQILIFRNEASQLLELVKKSKP